MSNPDCTESTDIPDWAQQPILGFTTWSTQLLNSVSGYGGKSVSPWFNEAEIMDISNTLREKMPKYQFINLDGGWSNYYDEYGRWLYRKDLFPNGLRYLSDFLAQNGQKLGLYILPGIPKDAAEANLPIKGTNVRLGDITKLKKEGNGFKGTTYLPDEHNEAVQAYYDSIGELFASWGVHYVKIDGVGPGGGNEVFPFQSPDNQASLAMLSNAFRRHDIWVEISWYLDPSYVDDWAKLSNGARVFVDIESYSTSTMTTSYRVFQRVTQTALWADKMVIGRNHGFFVDLDAVALGMTVNGKCIDGLDNDDIRQTYISFWALVSSVFCISADPRTLPDSYLAMLNHPDVLAIHQSGIMARPIGSGDVWKNRKQVWWKTMPNGDVCVCLFNAQVFRFMLGFRCKVGFRLTDIGLDAAEIKDVWTGEMLGTFSSRYSVYLRPGQCQLLFLTPK